MHGREARATKSTIGATAANAPLADLLQRWQAAVMTDDMSVRLFGALVGILIVTVFFGFVAAGSPERGFVAAYSTLCLIFGVRTQWDRSKAASFWWTVLALVFAHGAAVYFADGPYKRYPPAIFAPFAIADIYLVYWLLGRVAPAKSNDGYVPLSPTGAELLFEVFSQRYERGSTIVTSHLPFEDWT